MFAELIFSGIQPQQRCCDKGHLLPASALFFVIVRLKQLLGMPRWILACCP
jgi:hypothetical protein